MNVFDFDGTIYDGDSSVDFWLFCLRKMPPLIRFFPRQLIGAISYKLGRISKEVFKTRYFEFFTGIHDIESFVKEFWDKNERKIKSWYKKIQRNDDCVISASPDFLLSEICRRLGIRTLIATKVDKRTGEVLGKNCHGKNKLALFRSQFSDEKIAEFYSDSKSDWPIAEIARQAFIVKKNEILGWRK